MDVTQSFAATFVDELAAQGIEYACVSPGSRSAPLAMAFQRHPKIRVLMHIDERSGSFFGVGLAKSTGKPVVLLCTSGTAAAEFHAAVVEASYSRTPLIVLTAAPPPDLQGAAANQSIDHHTPYAPPASVRSGRWSSPVRCATASAWLPRCTALASRCSPSPPRSCGVRRRALRSSPTKRCCGPAGRCSTGPTW